MNWLKVFSVLFICVGLVALGGCAFMTTVGDFLFGVTEDEEGNPVGDPGTSPAAMLAGLFGFGNIAQGVGGLYLNARRKKWAKVGGAVMSGVNNAYRARKKIKDADGVDRWYILADTVFSKQEEAQNAHGVRLDAEKLRAVVESEEGDPDSEPEPVAATA